MKVMDILKLGEAFSFLSEKELGINTAYTIANNLNKLSVGQLVIADKRKKLIDKYGNKDEKGELILGADGDVRFSAENKTAFFMEMEKLNQSEIDMEQLSPIAKKALFESGITIPPKYILFLSDYIRDNTENEKEE